MLYFNYNTKTCPYCGNKCKHPYTGEVTIEQIEEDTQACILVECVDEYGGTLGYTIYCRNNAYREL